MYFQVNQNILTLCLLHWNKDDSHGIVCRDAFRQMHLLCILNTFAFLIYDKIFYIKMV